MKKESFRSILLKLLIIPVGSILVLIICYALYYAVFLFAESVLFRNNPNVMPVGIIRNLYAVVLAVIYFALFRAKITDIIKAIILAAPLAMLIVAAILALYITPVLAVVVTAAIAICCFLLLYRHKKSWVYYYSAAVAVAIAIAYAWPRS
ncbi:MAG: hypothetical protein PHV32_05335 [Eubacteriales bacterium]|nr:hypothetical protein [Eubacteriales bacterium]